MKILINEMEKSDFIKTFPYFFSESELVFLEDASTKYATSTCNFPFFVDENINNFDGVLKLCKDLLNNPKPIENLINWNSLCLFANVVFSIFKQKEIGRKVSDLEYLYEKYKNKLDITLTNTSCLNCGYTENYPVIIGKSKLGIMHLYKEYESSDFIFSIEYEKIGNFGKVITKNFHCHPRDVFEASNRLNSFMSNIDEFNLKIAIK